MIKDHTLRYDLANELHARPFPFHNAPGSVAFLALKEPHKAAQRDRSRDIETLVRLLDRFGADHPKPNATHYFGQLGRHKLKWESHTEFVTYTLFSDTVSERPFDPVDFEMFPQDWLDDLSAVRVTSVSMRLESCKDLDSDENQIIDKLRKWFVPESLAVSSVLDQSAIVASDFRIDQNGHLRFAVFVRPNTDDRRLGRIVQRLCEIEMYKSMSMLGFARVRALSARMGAIDSELSDLMDQMANNQFPAEVALDKLLTISAELETISAASSFRFGATQAYESIVHQRIQVLRENRFRGGQTFSEFMMRRYDPAMRTVKSTIGRLNTLADRAIRTGDLLRTRVDVERSAQNQALLSSMDRRADLQLKLQKTVEGFSVVAISYYSVSLASYALYPFAVEVGISKGMLTALLTLPILVIVWLSIQRLHKKMH